MLIEYEVKNRWIWIPIYKILFYFLVYYYIFDNNNSWGQDFVYFFRIFFIFILFYFFFWFFWFFFSHIIFMTFMTWFGEVKGLMRWYDGWFLEFPASQNKSHQIIILEITGHWFHRLNWFRHPVLAESHLAPNLLMRPGELLPAPCQKL